MNESEKQFSFTRAASVQADAPKSKFLSVTPVARSPSGLILNVELSPMRFSLSFTGFLLAAAAAMITGCVSSESPFTARAGGSTQLNSGHTNISSGIHLGSRAIAICAGADAVWVIAGKKLIKIDPGSHQMVAHTPGVVGPMFGQMAVGEGSVWVPRGDILSPGLKRYDLKTLQVTATIPAVGGCVTTGHGSVWITNLKKRTLSRIDPQSNLIVAAIPVGKSPTYVAAGEKAVWVLNSEGGTVSRIDPLSNQVVATIQIGPGTTTAKSLLSIYPACYFGLAVGAGAVWVTDYNRGVVLRIDPESNEITKAIPVGPGPWHVAASQHSVWVETGASLVKINPQTNEVIDRIELQENLADMACYGDQLWCIGRKSALLEPVPDEPQAKSSQP